MDKTSVLGDTIKYLKHLQERVKTLEEQATNQTVAVKKSQIVEDEDEEEDENEESSSSTSLGQPLPEVEARISNKSVLLKIHCAKRKGVLVNILHEIEKLNLAVVNINVTPFGSLALDITIIAEIDKEISVAGKEIVKTLRSSLCTLAGC